MPSTMVAGQTTFLLDILQKLRSKRLDSTRFGDEGDLRLTYADSMKHASLKLCTNYQALYTECRCTNLCVQNCIMTDGSIERYTLRQRGTKGPIVQGPYQEEMIWDVNLPRILRKFPSMNCYRTMESPMVPWPQPWVVVAPCSLRTTSATRWIRTWKTGAHGFPWVTLG